MLRDAVHRRNEHNVTKRTCEASTPASPCLFAAKKPQGSSSDSNSVRSGRTDQEPPRAKRAHAGERRLAPTGACFQSPAPAVSTRTVMRRRRLEVDAPHAVERILERRRSTEVDDAGVVDQDVGSAETAHGLADHPGRPRPKNPGEPVAREAVRSPGGSTPALTGPLGRGAGLRSCRGAGERVRATGCRPSRPRPGCARGWPVPSARAPPRPRWPRPDPLGQRPRARPCPRR